MKPPETLLQTDDVRVRIMTLAPGQKTARHHHSEVTDKMVCLAGEIAVICHSPEATTRLVAGEYCTVEKGHSHRVANLSVETPARYLLVQGVGRYDFIVDE